MSSVILKDILHCVQRQHSTKHSKMETVCTILLMYNMFQTQECYICSKQQSFHISNVWLVGVSATVVVDEPTFVCILQVYVESAKALSWIMQKNFTCQKRWTNTCNIAILVHLLASNHLPENVVDILTWNIQLWPLLLTWSDFNPSMGSMEIYHMPGKYCMKLLIYLITSSMQPLKFGNG